MRKQLPLSNFYSFYLLAAILFFVGCFALGLNTGLNTGLNANLNAEEPTHSAVTPQERDIPRYQQQSERLEQGDVDVLMVGDSITHLWESVGHDVWERFYSNRKVMNFGGDGDRTGQTLWRIEHSPMEKISPKLVVMMIGTNNAGSFENTPQETAEGVEKLVDTFLKLYPEAKILLLDIFPRGVTSDDPRRQAVNATNVLLREAYGAGQIDRVTMLDLSPLFLTPEGFLPPELMPDFLHPSAAGYELWAAAMEPAIAAALGETPESVVPSSLENVDWWNECYREDLALIENGEFDLVFIGDSITRGWDHVGKEMWEKYYGDKRAVNLGIGGDRTDHLLWRIDHMPMERISPKGIFLLIGVNNVASGHSAAQTALGIRRVVEALRAKCPEAKIVVEKVFPWGMPEERPAKQDKIDAVNRMIEPVLLGLEGVEVIDICDRFLDARGNLTPTMMKDGVHPGPLGYDIWGNALDGIVRETLQ